MLYAGLVAVLIAAAEGRLPAFPGAEGFGVQTPGGRGGKVLSVTTLADSGPGSLRDAVRTKGARTVVFRVGGRIELRSPLQISEPYLTIAGQSAPGEGITLTNFGTSIATHDVVIRFLRFRPGDVEGRETDALSIGGHDIVVDHCSASWATDETLSATNSRNVTVQWCILSESLNRSVHKKGEHGYGSLITGPAGGISFHHNLYAHHKSRSPRPGAPKDTGGMVFDFRNNVIYDWGATAGYSSETPVRMNYVGNYLRPGPSTKGPRKDLAFILGGTATRIFLKGNVLDGSPDKSRDNVRLLGLSNNFAFPEGYGPADALEASPFPAPPVATDAAETAMERVIAEAGASRPARDPIDERIVRQFQQRGGRIIDSQAEVGGWSAARAAPPLDDADGDGMADDWEQSSMLDPSSPADANEDADGDGYTNLEEFLNRTDPRSQE